MHRTVFGTIAAVALLAWRHRAAAAAMWRPGADCEYAGVLPPRGCPR